MSKKTTPVTTATPAKRSFWSVIGHAMLSVGKFLLIFGVICWALNMVLSLTLYPHLIAKADERNTMKVVAVDARANTVDLQNADGITKVYLMGVVLDPETPDTVLEKYLGTEVLLRDEFKCGKETTDGIRQGYLEIVSTQHILQMEMMIDGVAYLDELPRGAKFRTEFWECATFGIYPES